MPMQVLHVFVILFTGLLIYFPSLVSAAECQKSVATLTAIQGNVKVLRVGESTWTGIKREGEICAGESLMVLENSRATVVLSNENVIRIRQKSTLHFPAPPERKPLLLKIIQGVVHIFSHRPRSLEIVTPYVNGIVEGTEFLVEVDNETSSISVFEGLVRSTNGHGFLAIDGGKRVVATKDTAPTFEKKITARDGVQWSLYYPPLYHLPHYDGDEEVSDDSIDLIEKASWLLSMGSVEEALQLLDQILKKNPENSDALSLQTIAAVVQNDTQKALTAATKAIQVSPDSAPAYIAMSYVQQAHFNLAEARESATRAVELNPDDAIAWARLAELWSSLGYHKKSLFAAEKAMGIAPDLARTQMVLGFIYLSQLRTDEARDAFQRAMALDQADPLARLGYGLTIIREGNLKAGGREIEISVSLDPNNSLIRSYLGKVYFEEKRSGKDARQYAIAKQLDPNDPTPYFYSAISKYTENKPIEALHELQKARELNDNRAVYRSRFLLDSDEASRSASIAHVYRDLGFERRALVEGWQATNNDPSNSSAHRFLADSYAFMPRHEIARVSELLQAQLLQPLNTTPIQPKLAESSLFLFNSLGPEVLSFNEFHNLFNRNQIIFQGGGLVGGNGILGGEGLITGIYKKLAISASFTHYENDGWRHNGDQMDDIYNFFAQYDLSAQSSIQAEYRNRKIERGDTQLGVFEHDFYPDWRKDDAVATTRLGFHHTFFPGSDLIGNIQYATTDLKQRDSFDEFTRYDWFTDEESYGAELSYIQRTDRIKFISGGGYFNNDRRDLYIEDIEYEPYYRGTEDSEIDHTNIYLYTHLHPLQDVTLTLGGSGDFYRPDDHDYADTVNQFNPKFGITWNPFSDTTLRAAAFRVLKRTLISNQTLEPTQVAGFNQFFDEINSTDYWVYGTAVDQKFTENLYGGVEFTYRDLDVPYFNWRYQQVKSADWEENIARTYLFWTPHKWLAFSAEYLFEKLERSEEFSEGASSADTHQFPLGFKLFHPSGASLSVKGTYFHQEGEFYRNLEDAYIYYPKENDFFVLNAALRYRFPQRKGFFTLGVNNLTDEDFHYFDSDPDNPRYLPGRVVYSKVTLTLP